jgi:hypothetical protein
MKAKAKEFVEKGGEVYTTDSLVSGMKRQG